MTTTLIIALSIISAFVWQIVSINKLAQTEMKYIIARKTELAHEIIIIMIGFVAKVFVIFSVLISIKYATDRIKPRDSGLSEVPGIEQSSTAISNSVQIEYRM